MDVDVTLDLTQIITVVVAIGLGHVSTRRAVHRLGQHHQHAVNTHESSLSPEGPLPEPTDPEGPAGLSSGKEGSQ